MGAFGWSLPPGCGSLPGEEDDLLCACCGLSCEKCLCPECPSCGATGWPRCYESHGLVATPEQSASLKAQREKWDAQNAAEAEAEKALADSETFDLPDDYFEWLDTDEAPSYLDWKIDQQNGQTAYYHWLKQWKLDEAARVRSENFHRRLFPVLLAILAGVVYLAFKIITQ